MQPEIKYYPSETDSCRPILAKWCVGKGLDIGHGGTRPIVDDAITIDRALWRKPDGTHKVWPTAIVCDAAKLTMFADESLDYVYSSHCLEDFEDTTAVLREWLRVLKPGGYLVLFLPDEQTYERCVLRGGGEPNGAHKHKDFGLEYLKAHMPGLHQSVPYVTLIEAQFPFPGNEYSFSAVFQKTTYRDAMYDN